jgi:hypothetical protein
VRGERPVLPAGSVSNVRQLVLPRVELRGSAEEPPRGRRRLPFLVMSMIVTNTRPTRRGPLLNRERERKWPRKPRNGLPRGRGGPLVSGSRDESRMLRSACCVAERRVGCRDGRDHAGGYGDVFTLRNRWRRGTWQIKILMCGHFQPTEIVQVLGFRPAVAGTGTKVQMGSRPVG